MKEQFSDDYFFIKEVIHYLRNGNNAQKAEYKEKLMSRYKKYIKAVIAKGIKIEYESNDEVFNQFCVMLLDPKKLAKYRGDASFRTFIYPMILEAISIVMTPSDEERKEKKNLKRKDRRAIERGEARPDQYTQEAAVSEFLKKELELPDSMEQQSPEHLLAIKELRLKLDHVIAITILKMSQMHPKDIRILVMYQCDYSWEEIAICVSIGAKSANKRFSRSGGILAKFSALFIKTLWENYKIDFQAVSRNFNDLLDVE